MSMRWYVLRSKPNSEQLLNEQLLLRHMETFLPMIPARPVNPRARKSKPYFPGYIFIHLDASKSDPSAFKWIPGVQGFVTFGKELGYVPDNIIHAIRRRMEKIHEAGEEPAQSIRAGEPVIIRDGPFKGYEAIFDERLSGNERVRVLLSLFQREAVPVQLHVGHIFRPKYGV